MKNRCFYLKMVDYLSKCSVNATAKWKLFYDKCLKCSLPGPGKQLNPKCGWSDDGKQSGLLFSQCGPEEFNIGNNYTCTPCSICATGVETVPCTATTDTQCLISVPSYIPMISNQTINTAVTLASPFIVNTTSTSVGTFWALTATFLFLNHFKLSHCGGDGGFSNNKLIITRNFNNCSFVLTMNNNSSQIGVKLKKMDLSDDCNKEYLELVDGVTHESLGKYCGKDLPPSIITSSYTLLIYFVSFLSTAEKTGEFMGHYYEYT